MEGGVGGWGGGGEGEGPEPYSTISFSPNYPISRMGQVVF